MYLYNFFYRGYSVGATTSHHKRTHSPARSEVLFDDLDEEEENNDDNYDIPQTGLDSLQSTPEKSQQEPSITTLLSRLEEDYEQPCSSQERPKKTCCCKPSTRKWTPKKEALLCSLWEDETHMYDMQHRDYRNRRLRSTTIERFAALLNMEGS